MFQPLAAFVGLRYVRARSHGFFVSFITFASMGGICLGVAAIITIISVMNGFERDMRNTLLSVPAHATLKASPARMAAWPQLAERIRHTPGVAGVAPFVELQTMMRRGSDQAGAIVRGILPDQESQVSDVAMHMQTGSLEELVAGERRIILGADIALQLDARVGDEVTVLVPEASGDDDGLGVRARVQTFTVAGIFEVGLQEIDNVIALVDLRDAEDLAGTDGEPSGLRIKYTDLFSAPVLTPKIAADLGGGFKTSDWTIENASIFRAVGIEKTMMTTILMLVVAVAAFNIVAALTMVVNEKRTDIAILRTLGMAPRAVIGVFLVQGIIIGWFGALLGLALGLTLALNVESIVPFIENTFHVKFFDPTVYVFSQIPSEVHPQQVILITSIALVLTVIATIYPALRGAATEPAEALRYD
jgi:lipoprotein-releasing system permease protein